LGRSERPPSTKSGQTRPQIGAIFPRSSPLQYPRHIANAPIISIGWAPKDGLLVGENGSNSGQKQNGPEA
jgi:hypothetical protein